MINKNKFRIPRIWSNEELAKFGKLFYGKVVNVSAWKDIDKQGKKYHEYFSNASEYWITNYVKEARGFQGNIENEIFLDLTVPLRNEFIERFDVVFNHTVLEHIFEVDIAFQNLCSMTKDIVIVIVPFLQEQHGDYGDYWRFTPLALEKLFKKNNMDLIYINYNDTDSTSIYIFAIGSKNPSKWGQILKNDQNKLDRIKNEFIGTKIIENYHDKLYNIINYIINKIKIIK